MWNNEKLNPRLEKKPSFVDRVKNFWRKTWEIAYDVLCSEYFPGFWETYKKNWKIGINWLTECKYDDFMLCNDNFLWAKFWEVWRLIDRDWKEVKISKDGKEWIFEADGVKKIWDYLTMRWTMPEWNIYSFGDKWWMIADNGVIVPAIYGELYPIWSIGTTAIWKNIWDDGQEILFSISRIDGSVRVFDGYHEEDEYFEKRKEKKLEIKNKLKKIGKSVGDELYNKIRWWEKLSLNKNWKVWKFHSYMLNWKVWIEWILPPIYEDVAECSDSYIWVRQWWKWWLINVDGEMIIDPEFDSVSWNLFEMDGKRWFINGKGKALEPKYSNSFLNYVRIGKKMWFVDKNGNEIIEPKYDDIFFYKWCSLARVRLWDKYWLLSSTDWSVIKDVEYDRIYKDRKTKSIVLLKWNSTEKMDYSAYKDEKKD